MALNPKTAVASRNKAIDAVTADANSGKLRIYDSTGTGQPADADTAVTTQVLLAELTMNAAAFAAASGGSAAAAAITADASANASGTATWYRLLKSDGTTAIMDGSVGTATSNLVLNSVVISAGAAVSCTAFTITMAA